MLLDEQCRVQAGNVVRLLHMTCTPPPHTHTHRPARYTSMATPPPRHTMHCLATRAEITWFQMWKHRRSLSLCSLVQLHLLTGRSTLSYLPVRSTRLPDCTPPPLHTRPPHAPHTLRSQGLGRFELGDGSQVGISDCQVGRHRNMGYVLGQRLQLRVFCVSNRRWKL